MGSRSCAPSALVAMSGIAGPAPGEMAPTAEWFCSGPCGQRPSEKGREETVRDRCLD